MIGGSHYLGGMRVDGSDYTEATARIVAWARRGEPRYVCAANAHMLMETRDDAEFRRAVNGADLVTSDGMPLVWLLRWRGARRAQRVYGPDLMLAVCRAAAEDGLPIGLFGATEDVLSELQRRLCASVPGLRIACALAPAFGPFAADQNERYLDEIRRSGARILFVGLGCPKQERWMAACSGRVPAVLLGVGAAFAFHAGRVRQAPAWMQRAGLEWAFRLAMEPRRLWRRYLVLNPRFVWTVAREEWSRIRSGARWTGEAA